MIEEITINREKLANNLASEVVEQVAWSNLQVTHNERDHLPTQDEIFAELFEEDYSVPDLESNPSFKYKAEYRILYEEQYNHLYNKIGEFKV